MIKMLMHSKLMLVVLVSIITFGVLGMSLSFGFWRDDWLYVWALETAKDPGLLIGTKIWVSYPLIYLRLSLLSQILGANPLHWQISNLVFRVISILMSGLFVQSMFKDIRITILSILFMSFAVGGLESATFLGANNVMLFIAVLTLGMSIWIKSSETKTTFNRAYLLSVSILGVLAKGEQWSFYVIPLVTLSWDVLVYIHNRNEFRFSKLIARNLLFWILLGFLFTLPPNGLMNDNGLAKLASIEPSEIPNVFASLGNLIIGSFIYIPESAGLSSFSEISMFAGICLLAALVTIGAYYLFKPSKHLGRVVFLLLWMVVLYVPNWVFEAGLVVGASHRYLAASSLAFYTLVAYFLLKRSKKLMLVGSLLFVVLNIYTTNRILSGLNTFRSNTVITKAIEEINDNIPPEQDDFVILYAGDGAIRGYILDWSLGIPVAMKRNITKREKFPIWIGDINKAIDLVCGKEVSVNLVGRGESFVRGGYKYSLEQIHAFYVHDGGTVDTRSSEIRSQIEVNKNCLN